MSNLKMAAQTAMQAAAQRKMGTQKKFKGKYAGPDKYKGVVPAHLKSKYKGKYFGKEAGKGANPTVSSSPAASAPKNDSQSNLISAVQNQAGPKAATSKRLKTDAERVMGQARLAQHKASWTPEKAAANKAAIEAYKAKHQAPVAPQ